MIPDTRSRSAAARAGHDPAGAPVEPHAGHWRRLRPARGGGLRDSRGGESEAVLLLVARVVPVLSEPGPRRALLRADPVRGPGRMGDRAATDRGDDLRNAARDGGPLPAGVPRPARSLLVDRPGRSRARCAASLEGAIPQRAVLPDPGGALLRMLVLHRPPLLPRLARSGRDGGSRGVGPPAPPRRARHHRPRADPDLRLDRLDHVAHAALVLDHLRRLFLRGFLRRVHRASLGRRGGDARGRGCSTRSSAPSTCTISESSSSRSRRSGPTSPSPSSSSCGTRTSRRRRSGTRRGSRGPG